MTSSRTLMPGSQRALGYSSAPVWRIHTNHRERRPPIVILIQMLEQEGPANLPFHAPIPIQMSEFAFLRVSSAPKYAGMLRYLGLALCVAFRCELIGNMGLL